MVSLPANHGSRRGMPRAPNNNQILPLTAPLRSGRWGTDADGRQAGGQTGQADRAISFSRREISPSGVCPKTASPEWGFRVKISGCAMAHGVMYDGVNAGTASDVCRGDSQSAGQRQLVLQGSSRASSLSLPLSLSLSLQPHSHLHSHSHSHSTEYKRDTGFTSAAAGSGARKRECE